MQTMTTPIAADFAPVNRDDWLVLVKKTLKAGGVDTLISHTADGLAILPLYTADSATRPAQILAPTHGGDRAWDVRAAVRAAEPAEANRQTLNALAGGASSVLLSIDSTGERGAAIGSADELAAVLDGVMLDLAPVALDAGFMGLVCAGWLASATKAAPGARPAFHGDPLSALAEFGQSPGSIEAHISAWARDAVGLASTYPRATLYLASGSVVHEAGGTAALELAFAAAAAVAYAKALVGTGFTMRDAFERVVLGLSIDQEPLTSIAKLRAARVIWRRITLVCGVESPAVIETRSSRLMLTRADRWSNLVRLTSAGFASAVGGADATVLGCFTDAAGEPDDLALRMSRNAQLILMEEAHLGRVMDPFAGAWSVETLTDDLARAAWGAFTDIEASGGIIASLTNGLIAAKVAASCTALWAAISDGSRKIIGVTDFAGGDSAGDLAARVRRTTTAPDVRQPGADSICPPLKPVRLEAMTQ